MPRGRKRPDGFTLTEILVVIALVSVAAIVITYGFQSLLRANQTISNRQKEADSARTALARFAKDVRGARAILSARPEKIALWIHDADSDQAASAIEIVTYQYNRDLDASSAPWNRVSAGGEERIATLADMRVGVDSSPPATRHLVIDIAYGSVSDSHWIGSSVALREDFHAPQQP